MADPTHVCIVCPHKGQSCSLCLRQMASADTLFTLWTNKRDGKQQIRKAQGVGGGTR